MTLRSAVIGTGFMGWVHVEALRRAGVQPIGVLGSNEAKSQQAAGQLKLPNAYTSLEALLADDDVDAVHIATPNRLHFEMARAALLAGKHVLCEKPLTMTSAESRELVDLAASRPTQAAAVNYNIRFYPLCIEMRERRRTGEFGRLFSVAGGYVQDWLLYENDYNWRVLGKEGGDLRAIADIGTHWLDLACWITGERVASVFADLQTVHPVRQRPTGEVETFTGAGGRGDTEAVAIDTEDAGVVLLRFASGARGVLQVSQITAGRKNCLRLEIAGQDAAAYWNSEQPNELWLGARGSANRQLLRDPSLLCEGAQRYADYPGGHNEGYADSFKQCFRAFYDYIAAQQWDRPPDFPTFADGHREVQFCEAVLRSHQTETWVALEGAD